MVENQNNLISNEEKLLDLPELSIDSTSNDNFIGEYINGNNI